MNTKVEKQIRYTNRIPINDIETLRKIVGKEPNDYVILLGRNLIGDGDAREYYWVADSTEIDDGDLVINPNLLNTNVSGRWIKVVRFGIDATLVSKKYTITGDGRTTTFILNHRLNTLDVMVEVYAKNNTTSETIDTNIHRTLDTIIIIFKTVPANGDKYRILILTI